MKLELDQTDIEAIATRIKELLKPTIATMGRGEQQDNIFDVHTLAKHLGVDPSWIYKQVSLKTIPYFKVGKYTRFRKKDIDKWIETKLIRSFGRIGG
jgi:excisionase family DNA binding protein